MGRKPYSTDLRERVVAEVASGASRRQAAARFRVSVSSAIRWAELQDKMGSVKPRPRKGQRSPLAPHTQWLLDLNAREADLTGAEMVQRIFDERGLKTSESAVRRFFERHRISFKKNAARDRARPA